ncbi:hypothetical protein VTL71DRAFT_11214 [Oculimacula yallundae]|uniref:Uncharacterized protein n=1 Tax=Oculimacula yallundae TaxID=86028 RepID=A0ABR4CVT8_9HELO
MGPIYIVPYALAPAVQVSSLPEADILKDLPGFISAIWLVTLHSLAGQRCLNSLLSPVPEKARIALRHTEVPYTTFFVSFTLCARTGLLGETVSNPEMADQPLPPREQTRTYKVKVNAEQLNAMIQSGISFEKVEDPPIPGDLMVVVAVIVGFIYGIKWALPAFKHTASSQRAYNTVADHTQSPSKEARTYSVRVSAEQMESMIHSAESVEELHFILKEVCTDMEHVDRGVATLEMWMAIQEEEMRQDSELQYIRVQNLFPCWHA